MTGVLGDVGQVASLVLLVLGVVAMYAAVLLLWRLRRACAAEPGAVAVAGGRAAVIVLGRVGL